ncbi:MAG TPA: DUF4142 domain-containing protein [Daejeonella sp.]|nr:DUF4142 domain-containing protein [Daejeonella sp.]
MKKSKILTSFIAFAMVAASIPAIAQKLTDPEIASVAVVANQIDIDNAKIAKERSKDTEVLKFAQTMATDHKAVIDKATALVKKLGVTPKDNATSKKLMADAAATHKMLRTKTGHAFNKAYIDNEVSYHKAVIETVEKTLIPDAENKELKELLESALPIFKTHLEHAEMVQKKHMSKMMNEKKEKEEKEEKQEKKKDKY